RLAWMQRRMSTRYKFKAIRFPRQSQQRFHITFYVKKIHRLSLADPAFRYHGATNQAGNARLLLQASAGSKCQAGFENTDTLLLPVQVMDSGFKKTCP